MRSLRRTMGPRLAAALLAFVACSDPTSTSPRAAPDLRFAASSSGPTVTSATPSDAPRDTTLDVQINGSGFDRGSVASLPLRGVVDPRVRVNSTRYVKSTQLVANVTIAADAVADLYDVVVVTAAGKKGIGTEQFEVTLKAELLTDGSRATSVNASGDVVGYGPSGITCPSAFLPMLWRLDGSKVLLPLGSYCGGNTKVINRSGVILGYLSGGAVNASGLWTPQGTGYTLAEIGPNPDGYRPITGGMNDLLEVIGWGQNGAQVFWWSTATGWISMAVPTGATACQVWKGINNNGVIVGRCTVSGVENPYYWASRTALPSLLPKPVGAGNVAAIDINDAGVIVGRSTGSPGRALRWTPSGSSYTVQVLPDAGYGANANDVTEDGTISGEVTTKGTGFSRPAYWPPSSGYRLLGLKSSGSWGDAPAIALTSSGLMVVGSERNQQALRWRSAP